MINRKAARAHPLVGEERPSAPFHKYISDATMTEMRRLVKPEYVEALESLCKEHSVSCYVESQQIRVLGESERDVTAVVVALEEVGKHTR